MMDREKLEADVKRLAEIAGDGKNTRTSPDDAAEAVGIAIGLVGVAVIALTDLAGSVALIARSLDEAVYGDGSINVDARVQSR